MKGSVKAHSQWSKRFGSVFVLAALALLGWQAGRFLGATALAPDPMTRAERASEPAEPELARERVASSAPALPAASLPPMPQASPEDHPRFVRDPSEWQGMRQPVEFVWPCGADGSCSMARACIAGRCLPCARDAECREDELCALGNCVRKELADCSSRKDCGSGELCVLSGYTPADARGNRTLRAVCLAPEGGSALAALERELPEPPTNTQPALAVPASPSERATELLRATLQR